MLHRSGTQGTKKERRRSPKEAPSGKRGKDDEIEEEPEVERGTPSRVQPTEELMNIELIPGDPGKNNANWLSNE
ncbi:UNVERIFIED_CONTAM: hypothetical protein Sradi_2981700 [Sesamum radiatum]|uniref:Uncharacterized protein n=1 Tax=Sesamum radiatum TaxID=300843 RepID=A0AAW2S0C7_SESRA